LLKAEFTFQMMRFIYNHMRSNQDFRGDWVMDKARVGRRQKNVGNRRAAWRLCTLRGFRKQHKGNLWTDTTDEGITARNKGTYTACELDREYFLPCEVSANDPRFLFPQ